MVLRLGGLWIRAAESLTVAQLTNRYYKQNMEASKSALSVLKQVSAGKVLSSYLLRTLVLEEVISFK